MSKTIETLLAELRATDAALAANPSEYDVPASPLVARHWALRSVLALTPAASIDDVKEKAAALRMELDRTTGADATTNGWELEADGCARHIAESIVADLLALMETR